MVSFEEAARSSGLSDEDRSVQSKALSAGIGEVFTTIVGKSADEVTGEAMQNSPRAMLQYLFPSKAGKYGVDTEVVAKKFGIARSTAQRWVREDRVPREEPLKKLRTRTRQTVTTKRGRAQMAKRITSAAPTTVPKRTITVHGLQGPTNDPTDRDYVRWGNASHDLTAEQQAALYDAWAAGGDEGALHYLTGVFQAEYVDNWQFHGIDGISWKDSTRD